MRPANVTTLTVLLKKAINYISILPDPVVWSAEGPVLEDGVWPDVRVQSKSSDAD